MRDQVALHFTVFILGFTGILGHLIQMDSSALVFWRVVIAGLALVPVLLWQGKSGILPPKILAGALLTGAVVGLHWVSFFHAIKISNVSITLASLSANTLLVALLEPLVFRKKLTWLEPGLGLVIIFALGLILNVEAGFSHGLYVGLLSAFLAGVFTLMNRKLSLSKADEIVICLWEMIGAALVTGLFFWSQHDQLPALPQGMDFWWLLILGTICTAFTFTLTIQLLQRLTAYSIVLAINLEPVYGFVLAALLFKENQALTPWFYFGSLLMLAAVIGYSLLQARTPKPANQR
jgi:drug/metabolite transporter (DMT)-like permease